MQRVGLNALRKMRLAAWCCVRLERLRCYRFQEKPIHLNGRVPRD